MAFEIAFSRADAQRRLQPADHPRVTGVATVEPRIADLDLRLHHHRDPEVRLVEQLRSAEPSRRDAKHRERRPIQRESSADDRGSPPKRPCQHS